MEVRLRVSLSGLCVDAFSSVGSGKVASANSVPISYSMSDEVALVGMYFLTASSVKGIRIRPLSSFVVGGSSCHTFGRFLNMILFSS